MSGSGRGETTGGTGWRNEGPGGCVPWEEFEACREALEEAIDFADEGWAYASDYFKTKWGYEEGIAKLRQALVEARPSSVEATTDNPATES